MALTVLLAWLPATTHCLMATVLLAPEKSGCCSETPEQKHQHNGFEGCEMCPLVSGNFLLSSHPSPVLDFRAVFSWEAPLPVQQSDPCRLTRIDSSRAPPDLACWQFSVRAALPGRSPSYIG